ESAKRLLRMKKVIGYERESETGKLYVRVESETTPGLVYVTCVHGQATDIRCQCPDFLQSGIMCKHLRAAALYIDELRKQEECAHLPEMVFATRHEARIIRQRLYATTPSISAGLENTSTKAEQTDEESDSDDENEGDTDKGETDDSDNDNDDPM